jgi:hypothetical protein
MSSPENQPPVASRSSIIDALRLLTPLSQDRPGSERDKIEAVRLLERALPDPDAAAILKSAFVDCAGYHPPAVREALFHAAPRAFEALSQRPNFGAADLSQLSLAPTRTPEPPSPTELAKARLSAMLKGLERDDPADPFRELTLGSIGSLFEEAGMNYEKDLWRMARVDGSMKDYYVVTADNKALMLTITWPLMEYLINDISNSSAADLGAQRSIERLKKESPGQFSPGHCSASYLSFLESL